jgi:hypothetical protein
MSAWGSARTTAHLTAHPTARLAAVVLVGGLVLAGCGGDEKADDEPTSTESSAQPSSESSSESPTGSQSESTAEPLKSGSADPNLAYGLDLPAGVHLTPLGSRLKVGETARIAWEPVKNTVGVLAVTVTRLRQGSLADFDDFILDDKAKQSTPYYVDAEIENIGKTDLGRMDTPLYLVNGKDVLVRASSLQGRFAPCAAKPLPRKFKPEASTEVCLVYFVANHGTLRSVSFRPRQEYEPISWTGTVKKPTDAPESPETSDGGD